MTVRGPRGTHARFAAIADVHSNLQHLDRFPYPLQATATRGLASVGNLIGSQKR
jgi:hypothetical protein